MVVLALSRVRKRSTPASLGDSRALGEERIRASGRGFGREGERDQGVGKVRWASPTLSSSMAAWYVHCTSRAAVGISGPGKAPSGALEAGHVAEPAAAPALAV